MSKRRTKLPQGWTEARVRHVLDHYEHQSDEEARSEDEASAKQKGLTLMSVPNELVPAVRALIAKTK